MHLGIGSVLIIGYFIEGRVSGLLGIAGALPRENWEVQLHLLMKLVGSSIATGLERIEIQHHLLRARIGTDRRNVQPEPRTGSIIGKERITDRRRALELGKVTGRNGR